jgi:hypothetical protein
MVRPVVPESVRDIHICVSSVDLQAVNSKSWLAVAAGWARFAMGCRAAAVAVVAAEAVAAAEGAAVEVLARVAVEEVAVAVLLRLQEAEWRSPGRARQQ